MLDCKDRKIKTQCIHAGHLHDEYGAVVTPIYQVSTFKFKDADHGARLFKGEEEGYIYSRMGNPTVHALENALAMLQGGTNAVACATGMASVHLVFSHILSAGDHVVCSESVYGPTAGILSNFFSRFGIEHTFVDPTDLKNIEDAVKDNTKLVYIETPGNPTLAITDIKGAADIAHKHNAQICIDNTFMSPVFQKPFELGVDIVLHSMTKFINGHADVVAGCVIINDEEAYPAWRKTSNLVGGTIAPHEAFMVHRGIKTLQLRVEAAACNAQKIAEFLEEHPKVKQIWFPGLESFEQYELHKSQASGPGSVLAFELEGGFDAGKALMNNIEVFALAVSLGGVESLIQHPASMTHASMTPEQRSNAGITEGLVRIAVGIECCEELIEALEEGLKHC